MEVWISREKYLNQEDVCSCLGKGNGHGLSDTSCSSCDKSRLTLERVELLYGRHCAFQSSDLSDGNDGVGFELRYKRGLLNCNEFEIRAGTRSQVRLLTKRSLNGKSSRHFNPSAAASLVNTRKPLGTQRNPTFSNADDAGQQTPKWEAVSTIVCFWVKLAACT